MSNSPSLNGRETPSVTWASSRSALVTTMGSISTPANLPTSPRSRRRAGVGVGPAPTLSSLAVHKQAAFKSTHSHIHIGELGEPELPLLGHLILKDQVAAVGRSGDGDAQGHTGAGCQVSRQTDSLVAVVRAVAKTSAGTGE